MDIVLKTSMTLNPAKLIPLLQLLAEKGREAEGLHLTRIWMRTTSFSSQVIIFISIFRMTAQRESTKRYKADKDFELQRLRLESDERIRLEAIEMEKERLRVQDVQTNQMLQMNMLLLQTLQKLNN